MGNTSACCGCREDKQPNDDNHQTNMPPLEVKSAPVPRQAGSLPPQIEIDEAEEMIERVSTPNINDLKAALNPTVRPKPQFEREKDLKDLFETLQE